MEEEAWAKAIEAARGGQEASSTISLTLDGALKSTQSGLPARPLLEQFSSLQRLSIANVGLISLAGFPWLPRLQKLILSENRISGGLEHLVRAGLESLRDLDLSGNKIQAFEDLQPLSQLNLTSLDLYQCPVARAADYRSRVFGLIGSLQYLDRADARGNQRSEDEEEAGDGDFDEEDDDNRAFWRGNYSYDYSANYSYNNNGSNSNYAANPNNNNSNGERQYEEEEEDEEDEEEGDDGEAYGVAEEAKGRGAAGRLAINANSLYGDEGLENVELLSEDENYETGRPGVSARGEIDVEDGNGGLRYGAEGAENDADEQPEDEEEDYDAEYLVQPIIKVEETDEGSDFESGKDQDGVEDDDEEDIQDDEQGSVEKQKRSRDSDDDERPPKRR